MKLIVVGTRRVPYKKTTQMKHLCILITILFASVTDRIHTNLDHIISTAEAQLFSPDTRLYLTAGRRNIKIRIWDFFNTGDELLSLPFGHTATIKTLAFSHDGKTLASASEDGTILLWDWDKIATKAKPLDR